MRAKRKNNKAEPQFAWLAFFILCLSIEFSLLSNLMLDVTLLKIFLTLAAIFWLLVIGFYKQYNWKKVSAAVVLIISTLHPIRFIHIWWLNLIIYGVLAQICAIGFVELFRRYKWKNYVAVLLLLLTFLTAWQTIASVREAGNYYIEDRRWNALYCSPVTDNCYQQIEHLPIFMSGWCYYCFWY